MTASANRGTSQPRTRLRVIVRLVLVGVVVAMVMRAIDVADIQSALRALVPEYVAAGIVIYAADRLLMAYKWSLLLRAGGHAVPVMTALRIYLIAGAFGVVLPTTVGADAVRLQLLRDRRVPLSGATASIVVERLLGILALACVALAGVTVLLRAVSSVQLTPLLVPVIAAVLLTGTALAFLLYSPRGGGRLTRLPLPTRAIGVLGRVTAAMQDYRDHKGTLGTVFLCSVIEQAPHIAITYLFALSVGLPITLAHCLGVVPLVMLLDRVPISIDGLGVREGAFVLLFGWVGASAGGTVILALLIRLQQYLFVAVGLLLYLQMPSVEHGLLSKLSRERSDGHATG